MRCELFETIADLPADAWDALAGSAPVTQHHAVWRAITHSALPGFTFRFALWRDGEGRPVIAAPLYEVTTDLAVLGSPWLRAGLAALRRLWPHFLKMRMLECGTPVTLTQPPFVHDETVSPADALDQVTALMMRIARRERHFMLVIRDFETDLERFGALYRSRGFHWVEGLPNTYLDIRWPSFDAYLKDMRSYYRSKLLKHLRRAEAAGLSYDVLEDAGAEADALWREWMVVHEQADEFAREVLTPDFYRQLAGLAGGSATVLRMRRAGVPIGHALLLRDGDLLRWLYFGRVEAENDGLYLFVGQSVVREAIRMGVARLEMGLTTYTVKQDLGAAIVPIHLAIKARSPVINLFVGRVYPLLNPIPRPSTRAVFKSVSAPSLEASARAPA